MGEELDYKSRVQNKATFQQSLAACEPVPFDFCRDLDPAQCHRLPQVRMPCVLLGVITVSEKHLVWVKTAEIKS